MTDKIVKSNEEWKQQLSREEYDVTRRRGTERAFTGRYWNHKDRGTYKCVCCGSVLFHSGTKFDSGTGWPSFYAPSAGASVQTATDNSLFMQRTEVLCGRCDAHLGHVFEDGPEPTGLRYCVNSAALRFVPASEEMRMRTLGWTGIELTTIGLGTWAMGGAGWQFSWGPQDDAQSALAIRRGLERGINWIDTAPAYGLGHSEEIVGKSLREIPRKPFIATKCSRVWDEKGTLGSCLKAASIQREAEESLRRLQVEVIDLYQIHWPMPEEDLEEGWTAVAELVRQGKVRYGGVSNFGVAQLERIRGIHPIASVQPPYSMLARGIEKDLLAYCANHRIGVVCYSPMCKGLLTGRFSLERVQRLAKDDHRRKDPRFQEPQISVNLKLVESLRPLAEREGRTLSELAIAWVLRRPEVTSAIVGARNAEQVDEFVGAGSWSLPAEIEARIEELLAQGS